MEKIFGYYDLYRTLEVRQSSYLGIATSEMTHLNLIKMSKKNKTEKIIPTMAELEGLKDPRYGLYFGPVKMSGAGNFIDKMDDL